MRPSKDEYYLKIAEAIAVRSTCIKHKYGAVIINNDIIIATGYNGSPRGEVNCCDVNICFCDECLLPQDEKAAVHGAQYGSCVAVHAEANAIMAASHKDLQGATLYLACLTLDRNVAPCNYCDRLIKNAGIEKVFTIHELPGAKPLDKVISKDCCCS